jgi:hypothetical protein
MIKAKDQVLARLKNRFLLLRRRNPNASREEIVAAFRKSLTPTETDVFVRDALKVAWNDLEPCPSGILIGGISVPVCLARVECDGELHRWHADHAVIAHLRDHTETLRVRQCVEDWDDLENPEVAWCKGAGR